MKGGGGESAGADCFHHPEMGIQKKKSRANSTSPGQARRRRKWTLQRPRKSSSDNSANEKLSEPESTIFNGMPCSMLHFQAFLSASSRNQIVMRLGRPYLTRSWQRVIGVFGACDRVASLPGCVERLDPRVSALRLMLHQAIPDFRHCHSKYCLDLISISFVYSFKPTEFLQASCPYPPGYPFGAWAFGEQPRAACGMRCGGECY